MKLRRALYRTARTLGDVQAVSSGNTNKVAKRSLNKAIGRGIGRLFLK